MASLAKDEKISITDNSNPNESNIKNTSLIPIEILPLKYFVFFIIVLLK
jgi:hypothetical protein